MHLEIRCVHHISHCRWLDCAGVLRPADSIIIGWSLIVGPRREAKRRSSTIRRDLLCLALTPSMFDKFMQASSVNTLSAGFPSSVVISAARVHLRLPTFIDRFTPFLHYDQVRVTHLCGPCLEPLSTLSQHPNPSPPIIKIDPSRILPKLS